jgi:hypothetical protein
MTSKERPYNHMDARTLQFAFGEGALAFVIKQLRGELIVSP